MKHKLHKTALVSAALVGVTGMAAATVGLTRPAEAATQRNGIAHYTVRSEHQQAVAEVLGMSQSDLENSLKTQTMEQLLQSKGISKADFQSKVKTRLETDLKNQGYSQEQIDKAMAKHAHHKVAHANKATDKQSS